MRWRRGVEWAARRPGGERTRRAIRRERERGRGRGTGKEKRAEIGMDAAGNGCGRNRGAVGMQAVGTDAVGTDVVGR